MDDIELFALGNMTHSSAAMFNRRWRILNEARKMIGEGGLENFNIRELCRRSDVASRTIYNAFESKENVIALAIRTYFDAFENHLKFRTDRASFEGALDHLVTTTLRDLDLPNYLRAVAAIYFLPTIHPNIRRVLVEIGGGPWIPWLRSLEIHHQIEKDVDIDRLALDLSNIQFAKVHEWGIGALSDDAFLDRTLDSVLLLLAGATRGNARTEIRRTFTALHNGGPLRNTLVAEARQRIEEIPSNRKDAAAQKETSIPQVAIHKTRQATARVR